MSILIALNNISKIYRIGSTEVKAVDGVSLAIEAGEFVAIMGPSGSGKSTLLNMLGFLDVPTSGTYRIMGKDVTNLDDDQLSILRNHMAGFIFQQFHLLPGLSSSDNVLLPTIYAGKRDMYESAREKLEWVGLGHRKEHYPNELSGGEQQRVAIARSMINEPAIIFADEPTGNLDTKSEMEIISILEGLNARGKTVIMVTHENEVAAHAHRIIRMKDGLVVSDQRKKRKKGGCVNRNDSGKISSILEKTVTTFRQAEFADYIGQAVNSIMSHKLRSLLSMLGILIGVASVISMLAIGEGAKASIESNLKNLGTNILAVRPGFRRSGGVALQQGEGTRLSTQDARAAIRIEGVKKAVPGVNGRAQAVYGAKNCNTTILGTSEGYAEMKASVPVLGRFFTERENRSRSRVAVLGTTVVKNLFGDEFPVGRKIRINRVSFTVIGVLPAKGAAMMRDQDDIIIIPVMTAMYRLMGKNFIDDIYVEVASPDCTESVKEDLKQLLLKRHRVLPGQENLFEIMDFSEIRKAMMSTAGTMSLLLGTVAAISLIVGGVGVMNIMLVSVKERTREIGLRKAIGGRRRDILLQFLVEAVIMTFVGGIAGILLGIAISLFFMLSIGWAVKISLLSICMASFFSIVIGIVFGIWPAMQASRLNPIDALRYE